MKSYECNHGNHGAELGICISHHRAKQFMLTLSSQGFEAHRLMSREDMEDMISWIKEAINADQD